MSGRELKINIPYRENGEKKIFPVVIDFISRRMQDDFQKMLSRAVDVKAAWDRIQFLDSDKDENEIEELKGKILSYDTEQFYNDRYDLLFRVLRDNGVKVNKFFTREFWEECVDVNEIMAFLSVAINKDNNTEKKNVTPTN